MAKARRRVQTEYCVHTGRPSWHQRRAGHFAAEAMCFWTKREAEQFRRRVLKLRPAEPAFITKERKLRVLDPVR